MMLRALLTGRWLIAFMVLPYTMLWSPVAGSGGVLAALLLIALLLFYFACLDAMHTARLDETRLGFVRERGRVDPELAAISVYLFGAIVKVLALVMLFTQFWVGLAAFIALPLIWFGSLSTRRWQVNTLWAEILIPLSALMLPIILVGFFSRGAFDALFEQAPTGAEREAWMGVAGGLLSPGARLATVIGSAMLAGYLLLCALRDQPADEGDGLITTATLLGRMRCKMLFFGIAAVATLLAIRGANAVVTYGGADPTQALVMAWPWSIAVFVAILSMVGVLLTSEREDALAVGIWGSGTIATGVFLNLGVV